VFTNKHPRKCALTTCESILTEQLEVKDATNMLDHSTMNQSVQSTHQTVLEMWKLVFVHLHLGLEVLLGVLQSIGRHRVALQRVVHHLNPLTQLFQLSLGARQLSGHKGSKRRHYNHLQYSDTEAQSMMTGMANYGRNKD